MYFERLVVVQRSATIRRLAGDELSQSRDASSLHSTTSLNQPPSPATLTNTCLAEPVQLLVSRFSRPFLDFQTFGLAQPCPPHSTDALGPPTTQPVLDLDPQCRHIPHAYLQVCIHLNWAQRSDLSPHQRCRKWQTPATGSTETWCVHRD